MNCFRMPEPPNSILQTEQRNVPGLLRTLQSVTSLGGMQSTKMPR